MYIPKLKPLFWTNHSRAKMNFYRLSESRVRRVLNSPKRIEKGVAPKTIAAMQPVSIKGKIENGKRVDNWTQEIWVMIEETKAKRRIISAWRYPGKTKPGSEIAWEIFKRELEESEYDRSK